MSAHAPKSSVQGSYTPRRPVRIPPDLRLAAAERLVGRQVGMRQPEAARRFLRSASEFGIELTHLWGMVDGAGRVGQVCLVVPHAGRTGMLFTSQPRKEAEERELAQVIDAACADLRGVKIVQGLLEPDEAGPLAAALGAGFTRLSDLLYLQRRWSEPEAAPTAWPDDVTVMNAQPGDDAALGEALERSYIDTLDCPELCGMREIGDVLESHRATGAHDPALWWVVRHHGRPSGALLLNPCPTQGHTELVYLGLAPELRGRGLARGLMAMGLRAVGVRSERTVTCAVDARNEPAIGLYQRLGFAEFARRVALVRPIA